MPNEQYIRTPVPGCMCSLCATSADLISQGHAPTYSADGLPAQNVVETSEDAPIAICQDCDHSDRCAAAGACQIELVGSVPCPTCSGILGCDRLGRCLGVPTAAAPSRIDRFNAAVAAVTDERGNAYGHPKPNFERVSRLMAVVAECRDPLARHALEMICVKVARLIHTPDHLDSWVDIAGYARTGVMVTDPPRHDPEG
jgi:hypothetical protein